MITLKNNDDHVNKISTKFKFKRRKKFVVCYHSLEENIFQINDEIIKKHIQKRIENIIIQTIISIKNNNTKKERYGNKDIIKTCNKNNGRNDKDKIKIYVIYRYNIIISEEYIRNNNDLIIHYSNHVDLGHNRNRIAVVRVSIIYPTL